MEQQCHSVEGVQTPGVQHKPRKLITFGIRFPTEWLRLATGEIVGPNHDPEQHQIFILEQQPVEPNELVYSPTIQGTKEARLCAYFTWCGGRAAGGSMRLGAWGGLDMLVVDSEDERLEALEKPAHHLGQVLQIP
jgi:hypothetical protein